MGQAAVFMLIWSKTNVLPMIQLKTNAFVGNTVDNCHETFNEFMWLVLS